MPCEEIIQVVGTLIPQDKESSGSVTSHEENAICIFEESRTLLANQLAQGEFSLCHRIFSSYGFTRA
jgi:hypothetical protein